MDILLTPELDALRTRIQRFIADEIIPMEADPRSGPHGPEPALRDALVDKARRAGLLSPHAAHEYGGMGLSHVGRAVAFEEAGYSMLGPVALNVFAPDEGNMHLLEAVATPAQKAQWLRPMAEGHIRSCFCMTEPAPGAGSDPSMLQTTARPVRDAHGEGYVIDGLKWFITGADGARLAIIMAMVPDVGATMFLTDMATPGITLERNMDTLDRCFPGGHGVVRFAGLRLPASAILGELGQGFRYAQVRLSPARLTHCMRWLGAARRAHDVAVDYARSRMAFGKPIGQHEGVGFMLADNEMDLHIARLTIHHCAAVLDRGELALRESSRAKVIVSEAVWRVADRCVQVLGGQGVTGETVVARIFSDMRAFRIYDGPSEVHRWSLAKHIVKGHS
ncbi:acyl-CoA dehydrogenase family protein [Sphaerotilus mobilis]|uniref:Alkylation response protein AidB-like acyl-CoA dehydrogenase n=1 Tax=Sphaerotilus mobilis TaxID=47994 RepID=A0A4V2EX76_9BURK|nr:acyl-CoA dehydrogenase family protein [Sphaerotilus mobilis]RZS58520.1 alkylation response protein AidB-like acyl-CoA dehydrogenase [Sphaerotilus mobilis]